MLFQMAEAQAKYFIKLGSFKQLNGLEKSVGKLPSTLRSHVIIVRSNSWYVPFAYFTEHKNLLYPEVSKFKLYFPDATIQHGAVLDYPVVRNYTPRQVIQRQYAKASAPVVRTPKPVLSKSVPQYQNVAISEEDNTMNLPVQVKLKPISAPLPSPINAVPSSSVATTQAPEEVVHKRYKYFNKKMLSGNAYYLAYKSVNESPDLLIKVSFGNHTVTYQPIIGEMKMTQANYLIEHNRLYMFTESFTDNGAYSTLEEHRSNHFLVSSWINGKKLNTLRYYYRLNDAKAYLGLTPSEGLANTLEEGSFDSLFIEE